MIVERDASGFGFLTGGWPLDSGLATLVFIHGAGGSSEMWRQQVGAFDGAANAVALDLPGHGRSDGPARTDVSAYAAAVVEFVDAIGAPRPVPAGLSMGGAIAQTLLLDHPGRFEAGVLIGTGAKLKVMPAIFETIEKNYAGFVDMIGAFAASPKTDPGLLKSYLEDTAGGDPGVAYGDFKACDAFDVRERLSEISAPTLVITAEDDKLTPPKYGAFLEGKIPGAQRVHIMDAGHISPIEKADEVNRAIVEFVSGLGR